MYSKGNLGLTQRNNININNINPSDVKTSGQPHVLRLWFGDKQEQAACKIFPPTNPLFCQFNFMEIIELSQH